MFCIAFGWFVIEQQNTYSVSINIAVHFRFRNYSNCVNNREKSYKHFFSFRWSAATCFWFKITSLCAFLWFEFGLIYDWTGCFCVKLKHQQPRQLWQFKERLAIWIDQRNKCNVRPHCLNPINILFVTNKIPFIDFHFRHAYVFTREKCDFLWKSILILFYTCGIFQNNETRNEIFLLKISRLTK